MQCRTFNKYSCSTVKYHLRDCSGFLQIESHITLSLLTATTPVDIMYYSFGRYLFRKISILTFSGLRFALVIVPDTENTLSDGTDVAGIHKSCFANFDR